MIKYGQSVLIPCLLKLFNFILSSGYYPRVWSEGYIVPIYKAADPVDPNNYRGITITSCIGKLINRILNGRLENFIHERGIMHKQIRRTNWSQKRL